MKAFEEADRLRQGGVYQDQESTHRIDWPSGTNAEPVMAQTTETSNLLIAKKRTVDEMTMGVSEEDMEIYKKKRTDANDPMAAYLCKDHIL